MIDPTAQTPPQGAVGPGPESGQILDPDKVSGKSFSATVWEHRLLLFERHYATGVDLVITVVVVAVLLTMLPHVLGPNASELARSIVYMLVGAIIGRMRGNQAGFSMMGTMPYGGSYGGMAGGMMGMGGYDPSMGGMGTPGMTNTGMMGSSAMYPGSMGYQPTLATLPLQGSQSLGMSGTGDPSVPASDPGGGPAPPPGSLPKK